ncbi:hypothetical protein Acor_83940 [Acrocarpospora corrugata]|uniref:Uncharacterized protein n=1 Tax=Acrocarpospora corrugata TaxID=35763 RepID=A0A5M3WBA8_9ACTN|nr:hypothetical protein Acor_83940 [Acrocarpospora corrugata]
MQSRVDDLHPRIPKCPSDDFHPPVMPVKPRLPDNHPNPGFHVRTVHTGVAATHAAMGGPDALSQAC